MSDNSTVRTLIMALATIIFASTLFDAIYGFKNLVQPGISLVYNAIGTQLAPNMVTLVVFDWRAFDTLGESLILAALFLRYVSVVASIVVVLLVAVLFFTNMPLAGKIKSEQSDSLEKMTFYVVVVLGILVAVIYWGLKYV